MSDIERLEAEWRASVEGMTFFGEPVQDMTAEQLLLVVGHLVMESERLKDEIRSVFTPGQRAMIQAIGDLPIQKKSNEPPEVK